MRLFRRTERPVRASRKPSRRERRAAERTAQAEATLAQTEQQIHDLADEVRRDLKGSAWPEPLPESGSSFGGGGPLVSGNGLPRDREEHERPVPVLREGQAGQLLNPADPVAQRVDLQLQRGSGRRGVEPVGSKASQGDRQVHGIGSFQRAKDPPDDAVGDFWCLRDQQFRQKVIG